MNKLNKLEEELALAIDPLLKTLPNGLKALALLPEDREVKMQVRAAATVALKWAHKAFDYAGSAGAAHGTHNLEFWKETWLRENNLYSEPETTQVTAVQLRLKCKSDIDQLQEVCPHLEDEWAEEHWAPGHSTGSRVRVCKRCEKILERTPDVKFGYEILSATKESDSAPSLGDNETEQNAHAFQKTKESSGIIASNGLTCPPGEVKI